jgi:hypothetical protein
MYRYVSCCPFGSTLPRLFALAVLAACVACSSYLQDTSPAPDTDRDPIPPANPTPSSAGSGGRAGSGTGALVTEPTPPTEGQGSTPIAPPVSGGGGTPAATGAAAVVDVCNALGANDACGNCVCSACTTELERCADTPGCAEILACVRESACAGNECYCGDARLTECVLGGGGNGPCRAAVLAAPGGKEPSLADPSGGPASDAALGVADCADDGDACGDVCDIEG